MDYYEYNVKIFGISTSEKEFKSYKDYIPCYATSLYFESPEDYYLYLNTDVKYSDIISGCDIADFNKIYTVNDKKDFIEVLRKCIEDDPDFYVRTGGNYYKHGALIKLVSVDDVRYIKGYDVIMVKGKYKVEYNRGSAFYYDSEGRSEGSVFTFDNIKDYVKGDTRHIVYRIVSEPDSLFWEERKIYSYTSFDKGRWFNSLYEWIEYNYDVKEGEYTVDRKNVDHICIDIKRW